MTFSQSGMIAPPLGACFDVPTPQPDALAKGSAVRGDSSSLEGIVE